MLNQFGVKKAVNEKPIKIHPKSQSLKAKAKF